MYSASGSEEVLTLESQIMNFKAFMGALRRGNDRGVADERIMDTGIRNQVRLELVQVHVQCAVKSERRGDGADYLGDQAVQMLVTWAGDIQISSADIIDSLVVYEERTIRVLDCAVCRENGIVWFDDCGRNPWSWIDGELELTLLAVVCG